MKRLSLLMILGLLLMPAMLLAQDTATPTPEPPPLTIMRPEVLARYPHDHDAFIQGLVLYDGEFYESTGLYGQSSLRRVDPETGEVQQSIPIDETYFAEGLALVDDRLIQITWQENTAFVYDRNTFELLDQFTYDGEGWGLCYDGDVLWMSDGSAYLTRRDPQTFESLGEVAVTYNGQQLDQINELECVGDDIWANIWQTNYIVQIDKATGDLKGVVDASGLLTRQDVEGLTRLDVLNGIAYDETDDTFYITGKLWPLMFHVNFVPVQQAAPTG